MIVLFGRRVISLFSKLSWCPGWSAPAQWCWFFQTTTAGWERQGHTCSWRLAAHSDCYQYSCYWRDDTDSYPGGKINIYILYKKLTSSQDIYFLLYTKRKIEYSVINTHFKALYSTTIKPISQTCWCSIWHMYALLPAGCYTLLLQNLKCLSTFYQAHTEILDISIFIYFFIFTLVTF